MSDVAKLLVPMSIEALVLSKAKNNCVDLSAQLKDYEQSILGETLQPKVNKTLTLEKGVHLHWTLPKALKHAFVEDEGDIKFPYVPNRWMVTRIQTNKGVKEIPAKLWIVESDAIVKGGVPNWVVVNNNTLEFKSIGKSKVWHADYKEANTEPLLTAVGAANPLFASLYPESENVFGFHDTMEDVDSSEKNTFSYIITGWYSNPEADPLAPLPLTGESNLEAEKKRNKEREWFKKQWQCTSKTHPNSCVLHASIQGVKWEENMPDGVPRGAIEVYAGNTAVEALSAQITKGTTHHSETKKANVENLLNALQYQLLDDEANEPSINKLKVETHRRSFTPKNRNHIWEITRIEVNTNQLEKDKEERIHFPNDPDLLNNLKKLNKAQVKQNVLIEEIEGAQQEYYFLWYKQALKTIKQYTIDAFNYEDSRKATLDGIVSKKVDVDLLETEINQAKNKILQNKHINGVNAEFELKKKPEDRFWEPNDPVLLLCGSGIGNTEKPILESSKQKIQCRLLEEVFKTLKINVPTTHNDFIATITINSFSIPKIDALSHDKIPYKIIQAIVKESVLLDKAFAADIALLSYKEAQIGEGRDTTSSVIKEFAKKVVEKVQAKPVDETKKSILAEPFSILQWEQAWSPLFMVWEVDYSPSNATIKNLDIIENTKAWQLEDNITFKNKTLTTVNNASRYSGISPFSNSVFTNLKDTIPEAIVNKYGQLNLIAQSLSGLNKYLLMQRPEVQLPPFEYKPNRIYNFESEYKIDEDELKIIGEEGYILGCNPGNIDGEDNLFNPLRAGILEIINLSVVDIFGQVQKVIAVGDSNNSEVTCSVTMQGNALAIKEVIPLPPRIVQPSRLQFHWLNKQEDIIFQDAGKLDNPIFGWLVPNYLDNNIMVYDGNGNEIVVLQITKDITKFQGIQLTKTPFPGADEASIIPENEQLKAFLENINSGTIAAGIMDLAKTINDNLSNNNPIQNNTSALFCGQPVAIARCSIGMELLGQPEYNQRWDESGKENTGAIETVKFPLHLGDYTIDKDGLLGYFIESNYKHLNITTNAPEFKYSESESFFKTKNAIKIALNKTPIKLTLLIDPSAGVHLSTGVLPTKFIELYHHNTKEILGQLNTSFMMAPFIADKVAPGIPTPSSMNTNWKWTHKSNVNTWQTDKNIEDGKTKEQSNFKKQQIYEGWLRLSNLKNK